MPITSKRRTKAVKGGVKLAGKKGTDRARDAVASPPLTDKQLAALKPGADHLPKAARAAVNRAIGQRGPGKKEKLQQVNIRLERQTIEAFKKTGENWQKRMRGVLSEYAAANIAKSGQSKTRVAVKTKTAKRRAPRRIAAKR